MNVMRSAGPSNANLLSHTLDFCHISVCLLHILKECQETVNKQIISWKVLNSEMDVVDPGDSLWFGLGKGFMLFLDIGLRDVIAEMIVQCEINQIGENGNASVVVGIGFVRLESHKIEHSDDMHNKSDSDGSLKGMRGNANYNHGNQDNVLYMAFAFAFLVMFVMTGAIVGFVRHARKKYTNTAMTRYQKQLKISPVGNEHWKALDVCLWALKARKTINMATPLSHLTCLFIDPAMSSTTDAGSLQHVYHGVQSSIRDADKAIYHVVDRSTIISTLLKFERKMELRKLCTS